MSRKYELEVKVRGLFDGGKEILAIVSRPQGHENTSSVV